MWAPDIDTLDRTLGDRSVSHFDTVLVPCLSHALARSIPGVTHDIAKLRQVLCRLHELIREHV